MCLNVCAVGMFRITRLVKFLGAQGLYGSLARGESNGAIFISFGPAKGWHNGAKVWLFPYFELLRRRG